MRSNIFFFNLIWILFTPAFLYAGNLHWASSVQFSPEKAKPGDTITFQALIKADKLDENDFTVVAGIDNKVKFKRAVKVLKAGKTRYIRFRWEALAGDHSVYFKIIPKGKLPIKKSDLALSKDGLSKKSKDPFLVAKRFKVESLTLTPMINPTPLSPVKIEQPVCDGRPLPDIVPIYMNISGNARPNTDHWVNVTFENRGQCATGPFSAKMDVYVQIPSENFYEIFEVGKVHLGSMAPCWKKTCSDSTQSAGFKFKTLNKPYVYYEFSVYADYNNAVEEFNEKNNDWERKETMTAQVPQ